MKDISNMTVYTEGMRKTLFDKCYFVDKVDANIFVDYGCGDGSLIRLLSQLFPGNFYIGFDTNVQMLELAKQDKEDNAVFVGTKEGLISLLFEKTGKKCIILNSVIHEIHSYCTSEEIEEFYSFVFSGVFDYICIRDMMPSYSINHMSNPSYVDRVKHVLSTCPLPSAITYLNDFESIWGSIDFNKNMYHFFLKYRYTANWKREVEENYFPICKEEFKEAIPNTYDIIYLEEFLLPYLKKVVQEDFGIVLNECTHVKFVLKRK